SVLPFVGSRWRSEQPALKRTCRTRRLNLQRLSGVRVNLIVLAWQPVHWLRIRSRAPMTVAIHRNLVRTVPPRLFTIYQTIALHEEQGRKRANLMPRISEGDLGNETPE